MLVVISFVNVDDAVRTSTKAKGEAFFHRNGFRLSSVRVSVNLLETVSSEKIESP